MYQIIHQQSRLSIADKIFHKALESYHDANKIFETTVELGSGNYEHFKYVKHKYSNYYFIDKRTPSLNPPVSTIGETKFINADALKLPFEDDSVDRILTTCLLMHLNEPVDALEEWNRILKPGGILEIMVPAEPGIALTLFQKWFSERNAAKNKIEPSVYRLINAFDHVSSFVRLKELIKFVEEPIRYARPAAMVE